MWKVRKQVRSAKGMRTFNYSLIKEQKWDSELLGYIAAIYKEAGKQEELIMPSENNTLIELFRDEIKG